MAGGYTVGVASETKAFKQGIESGVIEPLEDAQKELLALGKSKGPEQLERGLRDAQKATDRLKDETKDTARAIEREFRDSYRSVKKSSDDGMNGAKEGMEDFKQEANQTARESAASFDGSAESIVDVFQEIAANAFAGFGPAGAVAGLAAAAGIGLAVAGFNGVDEASEESKERANEWADSYIDAGGRILDATQVVEKGRKILIDQADELEKNAKNWGVNESIALLAMAGDTNALIEVRESLRKKEEELAEVNIRAAAATGEGRDALKEMEIGVRDGNAALELLTGEMETGSQKASIYSESLRLLAENTEGATRKVDEFGDTVVTLPGGKQIYIDAETGQATEDTEAIERKIFGMKSNKDITIRARAVLAQAERDIEGFMVRNGGREIRIKTRVITSGTALD